MSPHRSAPIARCAVTIGTARKLSTLGHAQDDLGQQQDIGPDGGSTWESRSSSA